MLQQEIVNKVLKTNITQERLGNYLEITRQSVAKISQGEYVKLSRKTKDRLDALKDKNLEEILYIIDLNEYLDKIFDRIVQGDEGYIKKAHEGFKFMSYWINDKKFVDKVKYHEFYFGHMNNFYPRFNQAALLMRDTLNRQKYPLLTFQIDYKNNLISKFVLRSFVKHHDNQNFSTKEINFPISFQEFIDLLKIKIKPSPRFLIYKDYIDDDWKYVLENVKKQWVHQEEIYDLSRLLNFFENEQNYYGPLIEDALDNFEISFDKKRIHYDCEYRSRLIVDLINMVSMETLHQKKYDKSSYLFDSHGLKKNNQFVSDERRKLKKENV